MAVLPRLLQQQQQQQPPSEGEGEGEAAVELLEASPTALVLAWGLAAATRLMMKVGGAGWDEGMGWEGEGGLCLWVSD
jgi:hypothetical protein